MASFFFSNEESTTLDANGVQRALLHTVKPLQPRNTEWHAATDLGARRHEVPPPSRFAHEAPISLTVARKFWRWLWDLDDTPDHAHKTAPSGALPAIRAEFVATLWDLQSLRANHVRDQIDSARSLRELWHLRADVFKVIALQRGQMEAQHRLDALDSHFPLRTSRRAEDSRGKVATW